MKQKNQIALLAGLIVVAGTVWYFERSKPEVAAGAVSKDHNYQLLSVENPQLHWEELGAAQKAEYKSLTGRNPFSLVAPPPVPSIQQASVSEPRRFVGPQLEPPPPPPKLPPNMKFFGYGTIPSGTSRRAFLTDGEDVFIVAEGDVLLNRFRIVKVGNASLEFEEVSSGRHGTAVLEEQAQPQAQGPSA
jgi:hypothetical protein